MTLQRASGPILALSLLTACTGDGDGNTSRFSSWEGSERYLYGYSESPDELSCDLYWATVGKPSNRAICRDCMFTFDLDMTYDAESSAQDGKCSELAADATFTYAYQSAINFDRYSGNTALSGYVGAMYEGYFVPLGPATFDQGTGSFSYRWGEGESLYYYGGTYGYYTDLHVGAATVK